jgi:succinate dehydrogenase / fumarate reductase cytochrome b subunit
MLDVSLSSPESFAELKECMQSFAAKLVVWAILAGLIYHTVAGTRHLLMDLGFGESLDGGVLGAKIVFAVSVLMILAAGVWIW